MRAGCHLDGATTLATRTINEGVESSKYLYKYKNRAEKKCQTELSKKKSVKQKNENAYPLLIPTRQDGGPAGTGDTVYFSLSKAILFGNSA